MGGVWTNFMPPLFPKGLDTCISFVLMYPALTLAYKTKHLLPINIIYSSCPYETSSVKYIPRGCTKLTIRSPVSGPIHDDIPTGTTHDIRCDQSFTTKYSKASPHIDHSKVQETMVAQYTALSSHCPSRSAFFIGRHVTETG